MKTLPSLSLLAAVIALSVLPIRFEFAVSLLAVAGLASMLVADYMKPARLRRACVVAPVAASAERPTSVFRLAA